KAVKIAAASRAMRMFFAIGLPEIRAPFNSMLSIIDLTFGAARMEVAGLPTTAYNDLNLFA
ncbi:MAG TPA: hypothetical protein VG271_10700, partial [Beijerinckiaceae bacterium]|nr:hypothetical protein [Beijerinckiaceae bacterium]